MQQVATTTLEQNLAQAIAAVETLEGECATIQLQLETRRTQFVAGLEPDPRAYVDWRHKAGTALVHKRGELRQLKARVKTLNVEINNTALRESCGVDNADDPVELLDAVRYLIARRIHKKEICLEKDEQALLDLCREFVVNQRRRQPITSNVAA